MDDKTRTVLTFLQAELKEMLDGYYAEDRCIVATRIVLDIFEHFEIPARQITCKTIVYNSSFREYVEENKNLPETKEAWETVAKIGGFLIEIGAEKPTKVPTGGKGYSGHLVAYLEKESYIVDIALPQAHRPRHKIYLKPLIAKVTPTFPEEGVVLRYPQKYSGDLLLDYYIIKNDAYLETLDWSNDRRKMVSHQAISAIHSVLEASNGRSDG